MGLAIPLLIVLALEKIHRGLGRAVFAFVTPSIVIYCFINDDKEWCRQLLNAPKTWWMK